MTILTACSACKTQYDVSSHKAGDTIHCRCGASLRVPEPRSHEARIVRCSSCGASRNGSETHCVYCSARFSLSDKGWGSMCPGCFCRLPGDARYCVECGLKIDPKPLLDKESELPCPRCKVKLAARTVGDLDLHECNACGGLWLGVAAFASVCARADREKSVPPEIGMKGLGQAGGRKRVFEITESEQARYAPCPSCTQLMNRRNYANISGVVIDTCRDCGVWLDNRELERVLTFIAGNGLERAQRKASEERERQERLALEKKRKSTHSKGGAFAASSGMADGDALISLLSGGRSPSSYPLVDGLTKAIGVIGSLIGGTRRC